MDKLCTPFRFNHWNRFSNCLLWFIGMEEISLQTVADPDGD